MDTAIIVVWSATLIIALILTLVILKLVFLIVRTERDILQLASTTLTAAQGIVRNTALIEGLETTKGVAGKILAVAGAIDAGSTSIEGKLRSVGAALTGRGGHKMTLLLTILTAALAAVLLIALVVSLFLILRTLQSVRKYIEKINWGVRAIEKETEMLGGVATLNGGLTALAGGLESVATHFTNVDRNVGTVGEALLRG